MASIAAYMQICQDDTDVALNAVKSAYGLVEKFLIVDTGVPALRKHPDPYFMTVREFCEFACDKGYPAVYTKIDWGTGGDHALVRNRANQMLSDFDWVVSIDSDEALTWELRQRLAALATQLPSTVVTVAAHLLTLYPDEQHYSVCYSQILAHGRFYRPQAIRWEGAWHEHQHYHGERLDIPEYHLHFRQLFRNRCFRQHEHWPEAWPRIQDDVRDVSELGVHWDALLYPQEDADGITTFALPPKERRRL